MHYMGKMYDAGQAHELAYYLGVHVSCTPNGLLESFRVEDSDDRFFSRRAGSLSVPAVISLTAEGRAEVARLREKNGDAYFRAVWS
jgi:hypothetical protein